MTSSVEVNKNIKGKKKNKGRTMEKRTESSDEDLQQEDSEMEDVEEHLDEGRMKNSN